MKAADARLATDPRLQRVKQIIISKGGFKHGDFELASGRKTKIYFNTKKATLDPEGISLIAQVIYEKVRDLDVASIGGLVDGSIPIATGVAQLSYRVRPTKAIQAFWVRDAQKEHGDKTLFEGVLEPNSKVIVVDDVATTGGSIRKAIREVESQGCKIQKIIVLLDREEGARENLREYDYECLLSASDFKSE